jgi:hypothetical protein
MTYLASITRSADTKAFSSNPTESRTRTPRIQISTPEFTIHRFPSTTETDGAESPEVGCHSTRRPDPSPPSARFDSFHFHHRNEWMLNFLVLQNSTWLMPLAFHCSICANQLLAFASDF